MRVSIEFYVSGETVDEIKEKTNTEWKRLCQGKAKALPQGTEVRMLSASEEDKKYMAHVVIKTKIED